jgi:hypothetical protein
MSKSPFRNWMPEIMYEEGPASDGLTSSLPFIPVPAGEVMPPFLFIFESKETGEVEPGPEGEELPVTEMELHQYASMNFLKTKVSLSTYNEVRIALGLDPLEEAVVKGKAITERIRKNLL